jgi:hypothetical protein
MIRCCNARRRGGKRCRKPALKDKLRCRLHGGRAGRPPGIPLPAHENAALQAARAAWARRMAAARAQGLITRFPGGKPPRGSTRKNKTVARAERVLKNIAMTISRNRSLLPVPETGADPALPPKPRAEMDQGREACGQRRRRHRPRRALAWVTVRSR